MEAVKRMGRSALVFLVALCALAGAARAAVQDYVPADAIAIIKVQEPVAQFDKLQASALFQRLQDPAFIPNVAAVIGQVRQGVDVFQTQLNVNVRQVMTDLLGREVALVALPDDLTAMVVEGRDGRSLQSGVDEFLRVQRATGDVTAESSSTYKGVTIQSGMQKQGERFHAVSGNVLVVSNQIAAVQKVLDVVKGAPALGATAQYKQASALAVQGAPVTGYLNGQYLEPIGQALQAAPMPAGRQGPWQQMARARLAEVLPLIQFGVLSISGDGALQARLTLAYKGGRIPNSIQAALPQAGSRMDVLKLAPPSAALVGARSLNLRGAWDSTLEAIARSAPAAAQKLQQGLDAVVGSVGGIYSREQLFGELGSQAAVFVLPPGEGGVFPAAALAVELRQTVHIPDALGSIVGFSVGVAQAQQNQDISLVTSNYRDVQLSSVRSGGKGPLALLSPTFGVVDGYLVVASTLEAAKQVVDASRSGSRPAVDKPGTPVAVLSVSAPQVRQMLAHYRDFLVKQAIAREGKSQQQAQGDMDALDKVLSLVKEVEFASTFEPGRTDHFMTIEFTGSRP
jgi:hypothetical protein